MLKEKKETYVYCMNCHTEGKLPDIGWVFVEDVHPRQRGWLCSSCHTEYWTLKEQEEAELQSQIEHNSARDRGDFWDD